MSRDGLRVDLSKALGWPVRLGSASFGMLFFLLPVYAKRLGASALEIGGLFSVFGLVLLLVRPLVGWALDRYPRKGFLLAAFACYAMGMGLFAAAGSSLTLLYVARLVQGLGASLLWISAYTVATDGLPMEQRGRAVGRVDGASAQGSFCGTAFGFSLLLLMGLETGWRLLFLIYGGLALAAAWLVWRRVPETRRAPETPSRLPMRPLSRLPRLMGLVCVTTLSSTLTNAILLVFLQDRFTRDVALLSLTFVPAVIVQSFLPAPMGALSDRFGRVPLIAAGLAFSGLVSLLLPLVPSLLWLTALWAVQAVGLVATAPAQKALVADLMGSDARGQGYGLYVAASDIGVVIGPLLGGWLYDTAGHGTPFLLNGLLLLGSAALALVLLRERPAPSQAT
ncbi:MAG: MFS transporter [Anaerolineae bacterium]|nr:MFS transporter [Anaerolineae bacterium]